MCGWNCGQHQSPVELATTNSSVWSFSRFLNFFKQKHEKKSAIRLIKIRLFNQICLRNKQRTLNIKMVTVLPQYLLAPLVVLCMAKSVYICF